MANSKRKPSTGGVTGCRLANANAAKKKKGTPSQEQVLAVPLAERTNTRTLAVSTNLPTTIQGGRSKTADASASVNGGDELSDKDDDEENQGEDDEEEEEEEGDRTGNDEEQDAGGQEEEVTTPPGTVQGTRVLSAEEAKRALLSRFKQKQADGAQFGKNCAAWNKLIGANMGAVVFNFKQFLYSYKDECYGSAWQKMVCCAIGAPEEHWEEFWSEKNGRGIVRANTALNRKRTNLTHSIKELFLGRVLCAG